MNSNTPTVTTKVATLALPTRETHVAASVWPGQRGMLFFLAELNLAPQTRQEFLQNINAEIERSWQEAKTMTGSADAILENIVLSVNNQLAGQERLLGNPLSPRYQLLLAYLSGQQIALTSLGHIDAFVISANKLSNALVPAGGKKSARQGATFDNLISGELVPGESLLLATPAMTDYFSWDRLRQMISNRPPGQSLREIERYMLQLKVHPPLGLICLKMSLAGEVEDTGSSMEHLLRTRAQTDSLLQPKLFSYLKSKLTRAKPKTGNYIEPPKTPQTEEKLAQPASKEKLRGGKTLLFARIARGLKRLTWLTSRESAKSTIAWWLEANVNKWRRLTKSKRALFLLGVTLLLAFSQSIVNLGRGNLKAADSEYYNQLVTRITEKQAEIEGVLIYGDSDKAMALYNEAEAMVLSLPRNSRSREVQWQALSQNLVLLARRLQYLNEITDPEVWSQLPAPPAGRTWQNLIVAGGKVISVASAQQLLVLSNDGHVTDIVSLPNELTNIEKTVALNNEVLLITQDDQAGIYNINNRRVTLVEQPPNLQAGSFYSDSLYYLSKNNRTIWRADRTNAGFASPTLWLRASQGQLPQAVSLTVDGSIYVTSAVSVEKFSRRQKQDFKLNQVNPLLGAVTWIYTAGDSDFLYLWESANKRLVVYDKSGKLIIQITLPRLENITATAVDGPNKLLYLVAGNTIYRVPILAPVGR